MTSKIESTSKAGSDTSSGDQEIVFTFESDDSAEGKDMIEWYKDMQNKGGPDEAHTPEWDNPLSGDPGAGTEQGLLSHELTHLVQDGGEIG